MVNWLSVWFMQPSWVENVAILTFDNLFVNEVASDHVTTAHIKGMNSWKSGLELVIILLTLASVASSVLTL